MGTPGTHEVVFTQEGMGGVRLCVSVSVPGSISLYGALTAVGILKT